MIKSFIETLFVTFNISVYAMCSRLNEDISNDITMSYKFDLDNALANQKYQKEKWQLVNKALEKYSKDFFTTEDKNIKNDFQKNVDENEAIEKKEKEDFFKNTNSDKIKLIQRLRNCLKKEDSMDRADGLYKHSNLFERIESSNEFKAITKYTDNILTDSERKYIVSTTFLNTSKYFGVFPEYLVQKYPDQISP